MNHDDNTNNPAKRPRVGAPRTPWGRRRGGQFGANTPSGNDPLAVRKREEAEARDRKTQAEFDAMNEVGNPDRLPKQQEAARARRDEAEALINAHGWTSVEEAKEWLSDDRSHGDEYTADAAMKVYADGGAAKWPPDRVSWFVRSVLYEAGRALLASVDDDTNERGVRRVKCGVCLGRGNVAWGDHTLHSCKACAGNGYTWRLPGSLTHHALTVRINGTDRNRFARLGLKCNPFQQIATAETDQLDKAINSLGGEPVTGPDDIRQRLGILATEIVDLCVREYRPGEMVSFVLEVPK